MKKSASPLRPCWSSNLFLFSGGIQAQGPFAACTKPLHLHLATRSGYQAAGLDYPRWHPSICISAFLRGTCHLVIYRGFWVVVFRGPSFPSPSSCTALSWMIFWVVRCLSSTLWPLFALQQYQIFCRTPLLTISSLRFHLLFGAHDSHPYRTTGRISTS